MPTFSTTIAIDELDQAEAFFLAGTQKHTPGIGTGAAALKGPRHPCR